MYGASVGRNGIGSDCRIASCLAAGLLPAIKPLASLGGYLWECRIRTGGSSDPYLREKVSALIVSVGRVDDPLYGSILASMISTCPSVLGGISPMLLVRPDSNRRAVTLLRSPLRRFASFLWVPPLSIFAILRRHFQPATHQTVLLFVFF